VVSDRIYPNPGSQKTWTDAQGRVWQRRGNARDGLDAKRVRTLVRRPGVLLATWWAGDVEWTDAAEEKVTAAERLYAAAVHERDVVGSEWKDAEGNVMLLLEHHC
jgi:hypothetical protein